MTLEEAVVTALKANATLQTLFGASPNTRIKGFDELGGFGLSPKSTPWAYDGAKLRSLIVVRETKLQRTQGYTDEDLQQNSVRQVLRLTYMDDRSVGYDNINAARKTVRSLLNYRYFTGLRTEFQDADKNERSKENNNACVISESYYAYGVLTLTMD